MAKQEMRTRVEANAINEYQLITVGDLERFRIGLLEEIRKIVSGPIGVTEKKWIKTSEAKKLLNMSSAKLHVLRANGELPFTRIGGIIYYDQQEIGKMFERNKNRLTK